MSCINQVMQLKIIQYFNYYIPYNFVSYLLQQNLDKAGDLLEEASQCSNGTSLKDLAKSLKQHLRGFSDRLEETRERLEDTSRCFYLLDKVPTVF